MYIVAFNNDPASQVGTLLNDLVAAHKRGVQVKVILDQNIAFERKGELGISEPYNKNKRAYEYLKRNGIDVMYDDNRIYTHAKGIVIDGTTVILGSTNWSASAFERNREISVLFESKEVAASLIKDMDTIGINEDSRYAAPEEYITLNTDVLINRLYTYVDHHNPTVWRMYFYLIQTIAPNRETSLDYTALEQFVYTRKGTVLSSASKRYYARDALKILQSNKLLTYCNPNETKGTQQARIVLAPFYDPTKPSFKIPKTFFQYGWDQRLSVTAQYCYCVSLVQGGEDMRQWSASILTTLSRTYKMTRDSFSDGFAELRHWNLLKIEYARRNGWINDGPSTYRTMPVYSLETYEKRKAALIEKYGKERYATAQRYAQILFCENDLYEIERIIELINTYGDTAVQFAFDEVKNRSNASSKRSMAYILPIVKRVASEKN